MTKACVEIRVPFIGDRQTIQSGTPSAGAAASAAAAAAADTAAGETGQIT